MAATDIKPLGSVGGAVLLAAISLPGLLPGTARAENPPEKASIEYKYLYYRDEQPGVYRISVRAPSVQVVAPIGSEWSFSVSGVKDTVSGATPRDYTNVTSSATQMHDVRRGLDGSVTYYRPLSSYSLSLSRSKEHDYFSRGLGLNATFSSEDHNTTLNVGVGASSDSITATKQPSVHSRKHGYQYLLGLTQAVSRTDLVQLNLGYSFGRGDFTDHYKGNYVRDFRPDRRDQLTQLLRWNHHFEASGSTLRTTYRHYADSWKVESHTLDAEWVKPLTEELTITPLLRYYTQTSAEFYVQPGRLDIFGVARPPSSYQAFDDNDLPIVGSSDQRLSSFGAATVGVRFDWTFAKDWSSSLRADWYKQRTEWRMNGDESRFLAPFVAKSMQVGVKHEF